MTSRLKLIFLLPNILEVNYYLKNYNFYFECNLSNFI